MVKTRRASADDAASYGALRSPAIEVGTEDGTTLHAEVDEIAPYANGAKPAPGQPTLVFVHGYALNLDCWHFQREALRGKHRMVFFDQRSHGRSGRSTASTPTSTSSATTCAPSSTHWCRPATSSSSATRWVACRSWRSPSAIPSCSPRGWRAWP